MRGPSITTETMMKVWRLHKNSVDDNLIAETFNLSLTSVKRIIKIMTAAQNGEDVDAIEGNRCQEMKNFAKKMFSIEEEKEETEKQEEQQTSSDADVKELIQKALEMIAWQNELLEQLLLSLGVDWKTQCKGVERR